MKTYRQHVRSDATKWAVTALAILLIGVILAGIITDGFQDANPYCWFGHEYDENGICAKCGEEKPAEEPVEEPVEDIVEDVEGNASVYRLAIKKAVVQQATEAPSVTLTATITPSTAQNKLVDWTVAWANPDSDFASGKDVEEYVTVVPASDGALTATVTCLQAFDRDEYVIITCTSRDSKATAECVVSFEGQASVMNITSTASTSSDGKITYYTINTNKSMTATVSLDNYFHDVTSNRNLSYVFNGYGTIAVYDNIAVYNDGHKGTSATSNIDIETIKNEFATVSLSGTTLTINAKRTIEGYYESRTFQGWGYNYMKLYSHQVSDADTNGTAVAPYFGVTVSDSVSGLSKTIYFRITESTSVSVDKNEIVF